MGGLIFCIKKSFKKICPDWLYRSILGGRNGRFGLMRWKKSKILVSQIHTIGPFLGAGLGGFDFGIQKETKVDTLCLFQGAVMGGLRVSEKTRG